MVAAGLTGNFPQCGSGGGQAHGNDSPMTFKQAAKNCIYMHKTEISAKIQQKGHPTCFPIFCALPYRSVVLKLFYNAPAMPTCLRNLYCTQASYEKKQNFTNLV